MAGGLSAQDVFLPPDDVWKAPHEQVQQGSQRRARNEAATTKAVAAKWKAVAGPEPDVGPEGRG
jgi:hypothetical protein